MTESLPFFSRLWLAWVVYFKLLFDGILASRVRALVSGGAELLPEAEDGASDHARPSPVDSMPPQPDSPAPALQLLAILQREGRFVDFLQQDLTGYPDVEIANVARVVHQGCRKALLEHVQVLPVRNEAEGSRVVIEEDFVASEIKLTGNVQGSAPYRGVLRHRGWRADSIRLPVALAGHDVSVLAPAEVEL